MAVNGVLEGFFSLIQYLSDVLFPAIGKKYLDFLTAPYFYPEMIWIVIPLIVRLVLLEFYVGRYTKEELGWNTAGGNSLVLIFVSIDLLKHIFSKAYPDIQLINPMVLFSNIAKLPIADPVRFSIGLAVGFIGAWVLFFDFFHLLPKKVAFKISDALPINLIAYVGVVFVYTDILADTSMFNIIVTIISAILLFFSLLLFFGLLHLVEPAKGDESD